MASGSEHDRRLAVLIDAENVSARIADGLFREVAGIGFASVRRVYGDFSQGHLKGWAEILSKHALVPQQVHVACAGKNAADIALVIDAMDLLHGGWVDGFCLVSSDSDFTRLATRIREQGVQVYGFGEPKTPESFRGACKRFTSTSKLLPPSEQVLVAPKNRTAPPSAAAAGQARKPGEAVPLISDALAQLAPRDGWYHLGAVGHCLKSVAGFDVRHFGCLNLSTLVERAGAFETDSIKGSIHIKPRAVSAAALAA